MKKLILWIVAIAAAGFAVHLAHGWFSKDAAGQGPQYDTAPVRRGDLVATFPATGTVEPEDPTDVGAQVAGRIVEFGNDVKGKPVDYTSEVKQGQLLARIDDRTYKSDLEVAQANLKSAAANVERSKADLAQLKSRNTQAQRDWERAQKLGPSDALAQSSYDAYRSAAEVAAANVKVGEAAIKQAQSAVDQAQANVDRAKQNLGYCVINSPVDGVIIDRRVNIGQTVVASLNAPSLFLIGKDLRHVQVWVAVNEADIGSVHVGQAVAFEVQAFPGQSFTGVVGKIRLNATMTSNVVTYTIEVETDNSDGRLLPYLTADVKFETGRADNTLIVPNAALKFEPMTDGDASAPTPQAGGADQNAGPAPAAGGAQGERRGRRGRRAEAQTDDAQTSTGDDMTTATQHRRGRRGGYSDGSGADSSGRVWVMDGAALKPIDVQIGVTNGADTAVDSPDLKEDMMVVTGLHVDMGGGAGPQTATNPFMPQFPRGGRGGGGGGRRGR